MPPVKTASTVSRAAKKSSTLPVQPNSKVPNHNGSLPTELSDLSASLAAQLLSLERDTMGQSWYDVLKDEFQKEYFRKLKTFLEEEVKAYTIYPPLKDVYSWSRLTPLNSVKVVILGQDPYHNVGQAHGLSFSVLPPTKLPGSLKNIYKQMADDVPGFSIPKSGDLTQLANQGVLWLNTSLTVRAHKAASHAGKGWETLTQRVIKAVLERDLSTVDGDAVKPGKRGKSVVFMAWGLPAQKTCEKVGIDEEVHLVLKSAHPSPLSAYRGFLGNGHFKKANEWLRERYGEDGVVDWGVISRADG